MSLPVQQLSFGVQNSPEVANTGPAPASKQAVLRFEQALNNVDPAADAAKVSSAAATQNENTVKRTVAQPMKFDAMFTRFRDYMEGISTQWRESQKAWEDYSKNLTGNNSLKGGSLEDSLNATRKMFQDSFQMQHRMTTASLNVQMATTIGSSVQGSTQQVLRTGQ